MPWVPPLLWSLYAALPVHASGIVGGHRVSPAAVVVIAAVWLAWSFRTSAWGWRLPAALLIVKAIAGNAGVVERGLVARYYANDAWRPPVERSVEFPRASFTRIDRLIDFGGTAPADLPLFYLNDVERFNFYEPNQPDRTRLPFSIEWSAYWNVADTSSVRLYLRGAGSSATMFVDGVRAVALAPSELEAIGAVDVRRGWRRVQITVSGPYGAERVVSAGIVDRGNVRRPFGGRDLFPRAPSARRLVADAAGRGIRTITDLVAFAWVAWQLLLNTRWTWTVALWVAAVLDAFRFALPWAGRLMLLGGGGDPMTYEFHARDIVLNGPLMLLGRPPGQADAFYYQPLYAYFLALMHVIFGDGFFGIVFVQRLLMWVSVALAAWIARVLFGERAGWATLGASAVFAWVMLGHWAGFLLGEILFIPLVCGWTLALLITLRAGGARHAIRAGVLGGLATLSRSTLFLAWPVGAASLLGRAPAARLRTAALMLTTMVAIVSCATLRNWIAARQFVPVTTGLPVNLYLGNQPPPGVPVHFVFEHRFYDNWFTRDDRARMAIEFARHAPRLFLRGLWRKLLYTLGFFDALMPGAGRSLMLIGTWAVALAGLGVAATRRTAGWWLPAAISASHAAAVVLIFPHVYGDRLILPLYVLLLPYVGLLLSVLTPAAVRSRDRTPVTT